MEGNPRTDAGLNGPPRPRMSLASQSVGTIGTRTQIAQDSLTKRSSENQKGLCDRCAFQIEAQPFRHSNQPESKTLKSRPTRVHIRGARNPPSTHRPNKPSEVIQRPCKCFSKTERGQRLRFNNSRATNVLRQPERPPAIDSNRRRLAPFGLLSQPPIEKDFGEDRLGCQTVKSEFWAKFTKSYARQKAVSKDVPASTGFRPGERIVS